MQTTKELCFNAMKQSYCKTDIFVVEYAEAWFLSNLKHPITYDAFDVFNTSSDLENLWKLIDTCFL